MFTVHGVWCEHGLSIWMYYVTIRLIHYSNEKYNTKGQLQTKVPYLEHFSRKYYQNQFFFVNYAWNNKYILLNL